MCVSHLKCHSFVIPCVYHNPNARVRCFSELGNPSCLEIICHEIKFSMNNNKRENFIYQSKKVTKNMRDKSIILMHR